MKHNTFFRMLTTLVLGSILLTGCSTGTPEATTPPEETTLPSASIAPEAVDVPVLEITDGETQLLLESNEYIWETTAQDGTSAGKTATLPDGLPLEAQLPLLEAREHSVQLKWSLQPETVTVSCWNNEEITTSYVTGTQLEVMEGTHMYAISAQWEQGSATYWFRIAAPEK